MNILKSTSHVFRLLAGIFIMVLLVTACSKDETMLPASQINTSLSSSNADELKYGTAAFQTLGYEVIKINHLAARTQLPDYQVTVYSSMNVLFEGRRNTTYSGKKLFALNDKGTFYQLKKMFESSHLFGLTPSSDITPDDELADVPIVYTTFNNGVNGPVTRIDYNDPDVYSALYNLRTIAEGMLGIKDLVSGQDPDFVNNH